MCQAFVEILKLFHYKHDVFAYINHYFSRSRQIVGLPCAQLKGSRHFFISDISDAHSLRLNLVLNRIAFLHA